jgi:RHS repeat-associated protein
VLSIRLSLSSRRLTQSTVGARTTSLTYGPDGFLASATDGLSRTTTFEHDALGRVTKTTRPDAQFATFGYDGTSLLTQLTPPEKPPHHMSHDSVGLLETYTPPALSLVPNVATTYAYDPSRRRTQTALPDGRIVNQVYDAAGRLSRTELPGAEGVIERTYDEAPATGHVHAVSGPDAVAVTLTRAGSLPLTMTWSGAVSGQVAWSYDAELRVATETAAGVSLSTTYDNDDLVTGVGGVTLTRSPSSGVLTNLTTGALDESIAYAAVESGTTRNYGEPTRHVVTAGATTLFDLSIDRDALGRIIRRTEQAGSDTRVYEYGYDLASRLSTVSVDGVVTATYTYDGNGNRLTEDGSTVVGVYDAQDRLASYNGTTYAHDANGNRLAESTTGLTRTFDHDARGTLRAVTVGGTQVGYTVDGLARRIARQENGTTTAQWLYRDALRIAAELDGQGALRWRFVYASGRHVPDAAIGADGTVYRLVTDQVGSLRLVVRASDGAVMQRMRHDAWGRVEEDFVAAGFARVPFGFAGGLVDQVTGLVHFGAREYDPVVGRWVQKDPIRFRGGTNLYGWCDADPLNWFDPTGEMKLPADPSGLPPEWALDAGHRPPNGGTKYRHPSGATLNWDPAHGPSGPGSRPHWHYSNDGRKRPGKHHWAPGDEVPDPPAICDEPLSSTDEAADQAEAEPPRADTALSAVPEGFVDMLGVPGPRFLGILPLGVSPMPPMGGGWVLAFP